MKLPQLSLRDLFWLVALVAMGCGWWVDHRRARSKLEDQAEYFVHHNRVWRDACTNLIDLYHRETNGRDYVAVRLDGTIKVTPKGDTEIAK